MNDFAIGVDLGGTSLRIAAITSSGTILEKITRSTDVSRRDHAIDQMCDAIATLSVAHGQARKLAGIGVGVAGIINLKTGLLRASPNLPGWEDYPVRQQIERRLGATVILDNDANVAALGEKWLGAARQVDDTCMVTLGTGVGGGLILQGKIWHGMMGMAGEPGHISVDANGPPCGCGSRGCLEQYASALAIKRMALEAAAAGNAPALARAMNDNPEFDAQKVYEMAIAGDQPAQQVFHCVGTALGITLAGLINTLNLPMYVIGGGVAAAWDAFAPAMFETVKNYSYVYRATVPTDDGAPAGPDGTTIITCAQLGGDAGVVGAARMAMLGSF